MDATSTCRRATPGRWNDRILEQQDQDAQMGVNFLLALVLVYLVMASLFESLAQPFAILFSIPFALPGAAWMLAATGTPFNLMAQIGLLILMGIVVNNGIVLLRPRQPAAQERARAREGHHPGRARADAADPDDRRHHHHRPDPAGGARPPDSGIFYYPLARTVMGGLLSSAVLTLLVLPYVSLLVEAVGDWAKRLWRGSSSRRRAPASSRARRARPRAWDRRPDAQTSKPPVPAPPGREPRPGHPFLPRHA